MCVYDLFHCAPFILLSALLCRLPSLSLHIIISVYGQLPISLSLSPLSSRRSKGIALLYLRCVKTGMTAIERLKRKLRALRQTTPVMYSDTHATKPHVVLDLSELSL